MTTSDLPKSRGTAGLPHAVVLGEILWDVFGATRRLGGAPLNFAAHLRHLGHRVSLISALGADALGREAAARLAGLDLDTSLVQTTSRWPTGTAEVSLNPSGSPEFTIRRPAAYDAIELSGRDLERLRRLSPGWLYFGTLYASTTQGRSILERLLDAIETPGPPGSRGPTQRFYDLNLRPGSDAPELVQALLGHADVVKLNEAELERVRAFAGLPSDVEAFCRAAVERFGLTAICVTLGEQGCALLAGGEYVRAPGHRVEVADTVGAGDAFAAAFVHGLGRQWPAAQLAEFANRVAAEVASRHGSLPP